MKMKFLGHASFLISVKGKQLLFDPFISGNPLAKNISIEDIKADYILITHGHQDHVLDVEAIGKQNNAFLISNYEIITWFGSYGLEGHPMNHGGKKDFDFGTVKYVNAIHSSVLPDGSYGGNPGGFVVHNDEISFYHAGDTALTLDMKLIPETCPVLDFAILPIGDNFTMGVEDAAIAAEFIQCKNIIGCHYNTFEPIEIDTEKAKNVFENKGLNLIIPTIGKNVNL